MIFDNNAARSGQPATLDDLFRRAGVRRPQALALADPDNREQFTDGAPRRLTYAQADRAISAIAARLRALDLPTDAVVALQLPNIVESVLALLAVLRAGMIAAPLPLLWHRRDAAAALRGIGARAILTCARVGRTTQAEMATQLAAELFSIRHVCAFGDNLPDGVVPLDSAVTGDTDGTGAIARLADPAAHIAAVTFDVTAGGIVPMARNHMQLTAGGLAVYREARLTEDAVILSTIPASSFSGIASTMLPWLIGGGTLRLHHAFDAETFAAQARAHYDVVVLPAVALPRLAESGALDAAKAAIALWRAPERMQRTEPCRGAPVIIDVASFGEIGLVATRREPGGMPAPLANETVVRSAGGTLMLRGAMVPLAGFPLGAKPHPAATAGGLIDTSQPCRFGTDGSSLVVTAPPVGIATVGGYRFVTAALDRLAESLEADATLVVLPQELTGERLAGQAADPAPVLQELERRGVNPLIIGAFRRQQAA